MKNLENPLRAEEQRNWERLRKKDRQKDKQKEIESEKEEQRQIE